jgi:hypothetical protein
VNGSHRSAIPAFFKKAHPGFAASHPVKPGNGTDNTFWTLAMFPPAQRRYGRARQKRIHISQHLAPSAEGA